MFLPSSITIYGTSEERGFLLNQRQIVRWRKHEYEIGSFKFLDRRIQRV